MQPMVIINSMLYEHEAIRQYVRMLRDSVDEQQAAFLQKREGRDEAKERLARQKDANLRGAMRSLYEAS
jgi:hypothetical protein